MSLPVRWHLATSPCLTHAADACALRHPLCATQAKRQHVPNKPYTPEPEVPHQVPPKKAAPAEEDEGGGGCRPARQQEDDQRFQGFLCFSPRRCCGGLLWAARSAVACSGCPWGGVTWHGSCALTPRWWSAPAAPSCRGSRFDSSCRAPAAARGYAPAAAWRKTLKTRASCNKGQSNVKQTAAVRRVARWYARSMMARACQGLRRRPALMLTADGEALATPVTGSSSTTEPRI